MVFRARHWLAITVGLFTAHSSIAAVLTTADFPTFGLRLTVPAGAHQMPLTSEGHVVSYQLGDDLPAPAIEVEVVPSKPGLPVAEACKRYADSEHAPVQSTSIKIGGEPSAMFRSPMSEPYSTRTAYVVVHGGRTYLFSGLDVIGKSTATPLMSLLSQVTFEPPQPPAKHLSATEVQKLDILSLFTITAPLSMRPTDRSETSMHYGIYDYTSDAELKNPLNLDIQHIQTAKLVTFADIKASYSAGMEKQLKTAEPFVWQANANVPGLWVSQPLKGAIEQPKGPPTPVTNRFSMLELAPGNFVQILFTFAEMPSTDFTAYQALSDRMLSSIKLVPTTQPAK